jgi:hypothetical protein
MIRFAVVTKTYPTDMALNLDVYVEKEQPSPENRWEGVRVPISDLMGPAVLSLRAPVFTLGEIMFLGEDGREVDGIQRKPDKWSVDIALYTDLDEAVAMSRTVRDE